MNHLQKSALKIRISQLSAVVLPRTKMNSINKLDPLCAHISQKDIHVGICEAYARVFPSPTHLAVGCKHCESQAKKIVSETASRSVADAVYSARYQSQCWFVVYWLYSTCGSRYGRQSGHVKPDLGTCVYSPAHHWLPDRRSRATVANVVSSAHECWKHVMCNYTTRHAIRDNLLFTRAIPRIFARFPCVLPRWWRATSCGKVFQGFATRI